MIDTKLHRVYCDECHDDFLLAIPLKIKDVEAEASCPFCKGELSDWGIRGDDAVEAANG